MEDDQGSLFDAFFFVWMGLGVVGFLLFYVNRDAAWKRRWWPRYTIFLGVVFVAAQVVLFGGDPFILVMAPMTALVTWLNIRVTRFCDACGRTILMRGRLTFSAPTACAKCGAELPRT